MKKATPAGTQRYKMRHQTHCASDYFRQANDLTFSSIGIGTCIGKPDEHTDRAVTDAIVESVRRGVNLIDTSISYRCQQGERSVKNAIQKLLESGEASRDELIICTKGGIIPPKRNSEKWFYKEYVESGRYNLKMTDLVAKRYCLHPTYLRDQIDRSLANLGVETIDIYYIHNPETQLLKVAPEIFYNRLRLAFEVMEDAIAQGKIAAYGFATWEGLRVSPNSRQHFDLAKAVQLAKAVAKTSNNAFRYIQLPFNLAMREALLNPNQIVDGERVSALEAIQRLGLFPITSRSIYASRIIGKFPQNSLDLFDSEIQNDGARSLQFTRSTPGLLTALAGMKRIESVEKNLTLTTTPLLDQHSFQTLSKSKLKSFSWFQPLDLFK